MIYKRISCVKHNSINDNVYIAPAIESIAKSTAAASSNLVEFASKRKADACEVYARNNPKRASKIDNSNDLGDK